MTITINLAPEPAEIVRQRAAERGLTIDTYVQEIVERVLLDSESAGGGLNNAWPSDKALAPFRQEVADSGMTDDEMRSLFEAAREELYHEKHGQPGPNA